MQKITIYRKPKNKNMFEEEFTVSALSSMGNPLELLSSLIYRFRDVPSSPRGGASKERLQDSRWPSANTLKLFPSSFANCV